MSEASELRDDADRSRRLAAAMPKDASRGALEAMAKEFDRDAAEMELQDKAVQARERRRI